MKSVTLSIEKKQSEDIEIHVPCFYKSFSETDYIGVLDENTVVNVYKCGELTIIKNMTLEMGKSEIASAIKNFHSCTESEFLEKFDAVVESISLHPKLAV